MNTDTSTGRKIRKVSIKKKGVKEFTYLGCPLTRNRSAWCYGMCAPDAQGHGRCGRIAPHSLKGRTQLAIANYKRRRIEAAIA